MKARFFYALCSVALLLALSACQGAETPAATPTATQTSASTITPQPTASLTPPPTETPTNTPTVTPTPTAEPSSTPEPSPTLDVWADTQVSLPQNAEQLAELHCVPTVWEDPEGYRSAMESYTEYLRQVADAHHELRLYPLDANGEWVVEPGMQLLEINLSDADNLDPLGVVAMDDGVILSYAVETQAEEPLILNFYITDVFGDDQNRMLFDYLGEIGGFGDLATATKILFFANTFFTASDPRFDLSYRDEILGAQDGFNFNLRGLILYPDESGELYDGTLFPVYMVVNN